MAIAYSVIPFAASAEWYAARFRGDENLTAAHDPKSLRRTLIDSPEGPVWLSVPIAKGPGLRISDHGNWPHVHLGAINARYGRYPYFTFLFDQLRDAYADIPGTLPEFNTRIDDIITSWIDREAIISARQLLSSDPRAAASLRRSCLELKTNLNTRLSILDAIFRLGKNTTLLLL